MEADVDCTCNGPPPPQFTLPPPPLPPTLRCSEPPGESCALPLPIVEAELQSSQALAPTAVIGLCSALLIIAVTAAVVFLWKFRRKMSREVSCDGSLQQRSEASSADSVIYEDMTSLRPPRSSNNIRGPIVQASDGSKHRLGCPALRSAPVFVCTDLYSSQDLCNSIYEEIQQGTLRNAGHSSKTFSGRYELPKGLVNEEYSRDDLSLGELALHPSQRKSTLPRSHFRQGRNITALNIHSEYVSRDSDISVLS